MRVGGRVSVGWAHLAMAGRKIKKHKHNKKHLDSYSLNFAAERNRESAASSLLQRRKLL